MFAVLIQKFILSIFLWAFYWSLLEFWDTVPVPVSLLLAVFYKNRKNLAIPPDCVILGLFGGFFENKISVDLLVGIGKGVEKIV